MKRILKLIGGLLAVLLVVALVAPMFISAEYLKAQLSAQVKAATGRDLIIKGDARVSLLPNIAVKVEDVTLGNPAGFAGEHFITIKSLQTGAALKPLLNKELHITGVTIEGASIILEETASGAKNWEFAKPAPSAAATSAPEASGNAGGSPLKQFAIGTVRIKDSAVRYTKAGAAPVVVEAINLSIDGADGASALKLKGDATLRGEKVSVVLDIASMGDFLAGTVSPTTLGLTLPSGRVNFKGEAAAKGAQYQAQGSFDAAITDVAKLQSWASGKEGKAAFPRSVAISATVKANGEQKSVTLEALDATLDTLRATGTLAIAHGGAVPAISGALTIPQLDLDTITGGSAAKVNADGGAPAPAARSDGWSTAPINASGLRAANAKLELAIGQLKSGNIEVADIAATINLAGGKLAVNLAKAALYSGTAKGTVNLDGSGAGVGLGTKLSFTGIQLEPLMMAVSGASKIKGAASLTLDVAGSGAHQRAIISSLSGRMGMNVRDGAVKGINIASFLRSAKQGVKGLIQNDSGAETTDFTELSANFILTNGVASNDDLSMKSPALRLGGKGSVNLPERTVQYRLVPSLVSSIEGQGSTAAAKGLEVPLIISGPWSQISVTPDFAGMINDAIRNPEALKQNLKDIKENLRDFNSPKDIGKALLGGIKDRKAQPAPQPEPTSPPTSATTPAPQAAPQPQTQNQQIQNAIGGVLEGLKQ